MKIEFSVEELRQLINEIKKAPVAGTTDVDNERVVLTFIANHSEKT